MLALTIETHPRLDARVFKSTFPRPLGELGIPAWLPTLLRSDAKAPCQRDEFVVKASRDLLRQPHYKPTGRGKPASEYLVKAAEETSLTSINAAVDVCNAVSLASGIPISVIDLALAQPPFRIALAPKDSSYVFNASGQEIGLEDLLCLFDREGPCANAVKDCQRTKTHEGTKETLSVIWGSLELEDGTLDRAFGWYRELLERLECVVELAPR